MPSGSTWEEYLEFKRTVLTLPTAEQRFFEIYQRNYWRNAESCSGNSATLDSTEGLRAGLSDFISRWNVRTLIDIPCGDFNWMRRVVAEHPGLVYVGGDIVAPLVMSNQEQFASARVEFRHLDLSSSVLPSADVLLCRDCLFLLSYSDTAAALTRYLESGTPLLLTTTHVNMGDAVNHDVITGDYRFADLTAPPYNFSKEVLWRIPDCRPPNHERDLCLWSREQVLIALRALEQHIRIESAASSPEITRMT